MRSIILIASAMLLAAGSVVNCDGDGDIGYDPCAGKGCGDPCTLCDPADPDCAETAVIKACDAFHACVPAPAICGQVCEHNGMTYEPGESFPAGDGCNTCSCVEDGTVVCTLIACGIPCGGPDDAACGLGEYCNFPISTCGEGDEIGNCTILPDACPQIFDPVCGCNNMTYGNACEAAAAGQSVLHEGECG